MVLRSLNACWVGTNLIIQKDLKKKLEKNLNRFQNSDSVDILVCCITENFNVTYFKRMSKPKSKTNICLDHRLSFDNQNLGPTKTGTITLSYRHFIACYLFGV